MNRLPPLRIRAVNAAPPRPDGDYVLYWMIAARRLGWNYGLDRALEWARELGRPLLIFEPLRLGYRWASVRLHRFCMEGMREHEAALTGSPVGYFPYLEPAAGAGKGLLEALSPRASVVVTDAFPSFFLPAMIEAAGRKLSVRLEAVDGNGIVPLEAPGRDFTTAHSFRRHLQKTLPGLLEDAPTPDPLNGIDLPRFPGLPPEIAARWPSAALTADPAALAALGLDAAVGPVTASGGTTEARRRLGHFLAASLHRYAEDRNHPDLEVTSGLSPYLHWGHIGAHEVLHAVLDQEGWTPARLSPRTDGSREGWWGLSPSAEAFLDQLVTWREIGFNTAHRMGDAALTYGSLPDWAIQTLEAHRRDPRPHLYDRAEFEAARTHDPLWNAAQNELRETGVIHNYLRMLWGKKILEWSASPEEALETLIHLNNRWSIDGRNPNSTSGIFWTLGRYDRGWPERPVFGTVRSMSSDSTRRKVELRRYLARYSHVKDLERR
jgi:deoxyribodipyrimidine photo-lyase